MGYNLTPVVKILLILNIGIFLIAAMTNFPAVENFMALRYFASPNFKIYQIVTHMFMHAGFGHLFSNMFGLFMFGPALEQVWGPKRFLIFYMVCGMGASLLYSGINALEYKNTHDRIEAYYQNPNPHDYEIIYTREFKNIANRSSYYFTDFPKEFANQPNNEEYISKSKEVLTTLYDKKIDIPMVGASGALFGILLGFGMLFPNTVMMLLFFPVPIKAKYFVALYGLYELYAGIQQAESDTVAHFAHLGGMLFGYFMIMYWKKKRDSFY